MKLNIAGQKIGAQLVSATDGSAFTGAVTVAVTIDAGAQATGSVGAGACAHEGNGYHTYAPAQAETNGGLLAFTFTGTGAVPATVQVYTSFPQTADNQVVASVSGAVGSVTGAVGSVTGAVGSVTGNVGGNVIGTVASVVGAVGSVIGNVGGNVVGTVGSVVAAVSIIAAEVRTAVGLASANLDTQLAAIAGFIDTEVAAVKAVVDAIKVTTDKFVFTITNKVDSSIQAAADFAQAAADKVWLTSARTLTAFSFAVDLSATALAAIWDRLLTAITSVGSIGKLIKDFLDAAISGRSSHAAADVWTSGTRTLTSFGTLAADVWAVGTRTLTSFGTLAADVWASATRTLTTFAADVRAAVGLAAANLDTQLAPIANLPSAVKKNTQLANFGFVMVLASDHVTPGTGLTVTATRSIDGAAFGACANAVTEIASGAYKITLAAADLNGDVVILRFTAATADARLITILTEP